MVYGLGGATQASLYSTSGIEALIQQTLAYERLPLRRLETQKDDLDVRKAVYTDIKTKMEDLRTAMNKLYGDESKFTTYGGKVQDEDIAAVTVGSTATGGTYDLNVSSLAQVHRLSSNQMSSRSEALGLSGTFYVGGAASRDVDFSGTDITAGTAAVTGEDVLELGSGAYTVEIREESGAKQFRLVDADGKAVGIADADGDGQTTSWQNLADLYNTTFDTGRGLTISFGSEAQVGASDDLSLTYTAQGAKITVSSTSTLNDIRSSIANATYADGNEVEATIVDNTLVLSAENTGAAHSIEIEYDTGDDVLGLLGFRDFSTAEVENLVADGGVSALGTTSVTNTFGFPALAAGRYFVEIGSGSNANKFRLVDQDGDSVIIAQNNDGSGLGTTAWRDISEGTWDTGLGLTITFSGSSFDAKSYTSGAASTYFDSQTTIQSPRDAAFTVNGLSVSSSKNSGLTDVVDGLTFDLKSIGSTRVEVTEDQDAISDAAKDFVKKLNDLMDYIKAKTESREDASASGDNPAYIQGTLARDYGLREMRRSLAYNMTRAYTPATIDGPSYLADIGIDLAENGLSFEVTSSSTLTEMLSTDFEGVMGLFENVMTTLDTELQPYLDGDNPVIAGNQESIDSQIELLESRIDSTEARLTQREEALRKQYQGMQAQIMNMQQTSQFLQAFNVGGLINQQY